MAMTNEVWIQRGPGSFNYFIKDQPDIVGNTLGQALTLVGARRKARRLLRRGLIIPERPSYVIVEKISLPGRVG